MKDLDMGLGCSGDSNEAIWSKKKVENMYVLKSILWVYGFF